MNCAWPDATSAGSIRIDIPQSWRRSDFIHRAILDHVKDCCVYGGVSVALVQLALDESGKLADSTDVVFGGCALENEESKVFGRTWLKHLDDAGVPAIHMKNAMRCKGEFKGWRGRESERDLLLVRLAETARDSRPLLIAAPMDTSRFRSLPVTEQRRLKNPVYYGFEACVRGMVDAVPKEMMHSLQIACDLSEEYAVHILKLFHRLRRLDGQIKERCHAITFADDSKVPALQLADMFAYSCRECQGGSPRPVILDIIEALTGSRVLNPSARMVYIHGRVELGSGMLDHP